MRGERDVQPFVACVSSSIHVNGRSLQQDQHRALDSLAVAVPGYLGAQVNFLALGWVTSVSCASLACPGAFTVVRRVRDRSWLARVP